MSKSSVRLYRQGSTGHRRTRNYRRGKREHADQLVCCGHVDCWNPFLCARVEESSLGRGCLEGLSVHGHRIRLSPTVSREKVAKEAMALDRSDSTISSACHRDVRPRSRQCDISSNRPISRGNLRHTCSNSGLGNRSLLRHPRMVQAQEKRVVRDSLSR